MDKFAYLFIHRDMYDGRTWGYSDAYPNCPFWKNWIFDHFLKPIADKNLTQKQIDNTYADSAILSDVCSWRKYYVLKYECKDTKCTDDPFAKGRDYRFKMYIILEGKPAVLPVLRFDNFIDKCIKTGYEILTAGINDELKIKIPDEFFEENED